MSNHTPGPWKVIDGVFPGFKEIDGPSFRIVAVAAATDISTEDSFRIIADSHLIAAAPDLLEALQQCLDLMNNGGTWTLEQQAQARAVIAKAEGKEEQS